MYLRARWKSLCQTLPFIEVPINRLAEIFGHIRFAKIGSEKTVIDSKTSVPRAPRVQKETPFFRLIRKVLHRNGLNICL